MVTASGAPGTAALLSALRRERRAGGSARRHRHERAVGRAPPVRRVPHRPGGSRPGLSRRDARDRDARERRRRPAAVVVRPRRARRARRPLPDAGARLEARHDPPLERQGGDLRVPAPHRRERAGVPPCQRRARGRGGGARARLPRSPRLLQAGLLVRLARLPHPRPDRRPRTPAAERAAGLGRDAARGGGRAAARRGRPRPARDGARDRRRAHDRRLRQRPRDRPRPREDARGDARRSRHVLRHARRPRADGRRRT